MAAESLIFCPFCLTVSLIICVISNTRLWAVTVLTLKNYINKKSSMDDEEDFFVFLK